MRSDKIRLYIIELTLIAFFLLAIIFNNILTRQIVAIILLVFMIAITQILKTDKSKLTNTNQITVLLMSFGIMYISIICIIGVFVGFYNSTIKLSMWSLANYIIPYIVIIISAEIIRKRVLLKGTKKTRIIMLIAMILLDMIIFINIYNLKTVKDYFSVLAFVIFSSIANNILYNYVVVNYRNILGIIIYRLATILYTYIIPITPNIYIFFESVIRLIVPYIIYIVLEQIYYKKEKIISIQQKRRGAIVNIILAIIVVLIVMLVSCEFKYGALTIGSGSMTGTIDKGDIIIYEEYDEEDKVETGDIIVFVKDDIKVVHRVVDQRDVGDEIRYYTKGDANMQEDDGYRTRKDIIAKVKLRIPYIGYLTLWVNNMFELGK